MSATSKSIQKTSTVLGEVRKRQQASQLILLAIVDKGPSTIKVVYDNLFKCLPQLKETSEEGFYFDLGWLDSF